MYCENCGTKISESLNYCNNCGYKLNNKKIIPQKNVMVQPRYYNDIKFKKYKKLLQVESILNIILMLIPLVYFFYIAFNISSTLNSVPYVDIEPFNIFVAFGVFGAGFLLIISVFIIIFFMIMIFISSFMLLGLKKQKKYPPILGIIFSVIIMIVGIFVLRIYINESVIGFIVTLLISILNLMIFITSILYLKEW